MTKMTITIESDYRITGRVAKTLLTEIATQLGMKFEGTPVESVSGHVTESTWFSIKTQKKHLTRKSK